MSSFQSEHPEPSLVPPISRPPSVTPGHFSGMPPPPPPPPTHSYNYTLPMSSGRMGGYPGLGDMGHMGPMGAVPLSPGQGMMNPMHMGHGGSYYPPVRTEYYPPLHPPGVSSGSMGMIHPSYLIPPPKLPPHPYPPREEAQNYGWLSGLDDQERTEMREAINLCKTYKEAPDPRLKQKIKEIMEKFPKLRELMSKINK
jgi:hypothetical protein